MGHGICGPPVQWPDAGRQLSVRVKTPHPAKGGVGVFLRDTRELAFSDWWSIFAC